MNKKKKKKKKKKRKCNKNKEQRNLLKPVWAILEIKVRFKKVKKFAFSMQAMSYFLKTHNFKG
jgi:hypothetical protein